MSLTVFVTGATGLLGAATVRALKNAGHDVVGLTSRAQNVPAVERLGARAVVGDMRDANAYREAVASADAVVHAASAMPEKIRYTQKDVDQMMGADADAVNALLSVLTPRCRRLVFTSGAYVYGDTGPRPVDETFTTDHGHAVMRLKIATEQRLLALAKSGKGPVVIARPGLVYGNGSLWKNLYLTPMRKGGRAMMPGDGSNIVSFIHVDDCGEAFRCLVEHGVPGEIYNLADDTPAALRKVVNAQAAALGAPPPRSIPAWLLRLVAGPLSSPPALGNAALTNTRLKALGFACKYPRPQDGVVALAKALKSA